MSPADNRDANAALGRAVRELRLERGLSQEELGEVSGLHATYISGIERARRNPTWAVVVQLARGLSVAPSELARRADGSVSEGSGEP